MTRPAPTSAPRGRTIARLALDAERVPLSEGRPIAKELGEAVRALDAAEQHLAVAVLRARRVAAVKKAR